MACAQHFQVGLPETLAELPCYLLRCVHRSQDGGSGLFQGFGEETVVCAAVIKGSSSQAVGTLGAWRFLVMPRPWSQATLVHERSSRPSPTGAWPVGCVGADLSLHHGRLAHHPDER